MTLERIEQINIKGKRRSVDSIIIGGKTIVVNGTFLKTASIRDELCDDGVNSPETIINELRKIGLADIFTFDQKLPESEPKFKYYFEWDNIAVLHITSFEDWWKNQIHNDARRMVRKAEKNGVITKVIPFSDDLVKGIKDIYDELPIRQGKPFWHYKKDFNIIEEDNLPFLERSEFIGAYYNNELIGFEKIIYTGNRADPTQLISKIKDRDKSPTNAIVAKSVEVCAQRGISFLTYGKYVYGHKEADTLREFKKRNGFKKIDIPRYYIPLTIKGDLALKLGLHRELIETVPSFLVDFLIKLRSKFYFSKYQ